MRAERLSVVSEKPAKGLKNTDIGSIIEQNKEDLRGGVQFPTGGKARDSHEATDPVISMLKNSGADSKVWMEEEK